jgi:hypothetical protein
MLSGKLKGMGGFSGKKKQYGLSYICWWSECHLLGYSAAVVFNPYNAAIRKRLTLQCCLHKVEYK